MRLAGWLAVGKHTRKPLDTWPSCAIPRRYGVQVFYPTPLDADSPAGPSTSIAMTIHGQAFCRFTPRISSSSRCASAFFSVPLLCFPFNISPLHARYTTVVRPHRRGTKPHQPISASIPCLHVRRAKHSPASQPIATDATPRIPVGQALDMGGSRTRHVESSPTLRTMLVWLVPFSMNVYCLAPHAANISTSLSRDGRRAT